MICLALSTIFFQILLDLELWYVPFKQLLEAWGG